MLIILVNMQAKYSESSKEDLFDMKDVNAWYAVEQLLKPLQQEIAAEIDREILEKLAAQFAEEKNSKQRFKIYL